MENLKQDILEIRQHYASLNRASGQQLHFKESPSEAQQIHTTEVAFENRQTNGNEIPDNKVQLSMMLAEQERVYTEQIHFYRNKARELERRNDTLLAVSGELKERVTVLLSSDGIKKDVACNYYKSQADKLTASKLKLEKQCRKLEEENEQLREDFYTFESSKIQ